MHYRTIKTLAQYKSYESYLEKLLWIENKLPYDQEKIDQLISLIREWDANHHSVSSALPVAKEVDPIAQLIGLMEKNNINPSDLASALHISQSEISDVLNAKKILSEELILKLSEKFGVSPDLFLLRQN